MNKTHPNMLNSTVAQANMANYQSLLVKTDNDPNGSCNSSYTRGNNCVQNSQLQNQSHFARQFSAQDGQNSVSDASRMLNANGVFTSRYAGLGTTTNPNNKTNSLGGGSSSSGVISNGASSPGHSPVGSVTVSNGTHV